MSAADASSAPRDLPFQDAALGGTGPQLEPAPMACGAGFHILQAMPAGRFRGRGADPVIHHPQHHLVGHHHFDTHTRRPRVTGDVAERFAQRGEELGGEIVTHPAVDRSVEEAPRFEPERPRGLATECQHAVSQASTRRHPRRLQFEDGGTDVLHREVKIVHRSLNASHGGLAVGPHEPSRSLQRQAGCEQTLDDGVVQITSDALAVFDQSELLHSVVESGVLNGDPGRGREADHEFLVDVGEHLGGRLVGQIQVAEHLVAHADGHAQERSHRRMVGREPEAVGMLAQIGQPQRLGVHDEATEDPVPFGQVTEEPVRAVIYPDRDELRQTGASVVEHAERAVTCIDQPDRRLHDPPEHAGRVEVRTEGKHRTEELAQAAGTGYLGHPVNIRRARGDSRRRANENRTVTLRVFLLDDHEVVRRGLRELLEAEGDLEVVGEAGTAEEAYGRIPAARPNVAILDVRLPDGDGVEVCREIRSKHPEIACLMLTSFADDEALFSAIMAGAAGYVLKQVRGTDLVDGVRRVGRGESLLDPSLTTRVLERLRHPPAPDALAGLTDQERRILDLIAEGMTNRQIGEQLFLAEKTVKNYVSNLLAKLGMSRRSEAAAYAARLSERHQHHHDPHA
jgi:two-component system response regulator DevR